MDWLEISINTTQEGLEIVAGALDALGIAQVALEQSVQGIARDLAEIAPRWDFADAASLAAPGGPAVKAYLAKSAENEALAEEIKSRMAELSRMGLGVDLGTLAVRVTVVQDEDWANAWKQYYKPMPVGNRLLIKPSWEQIKDAGGRLVLELDPGQAFGSGAHETTRMCLELLEETVTPGSRLLDLGCGSGILAAGGLLLGAEKAVLVDVDALAESAVRGNMARNGLNGRYHYFQGDILSDDNLLAALAARGPYDVITANIVAGVILPLTPRVVPLIKPGGAYIVSGIIAERESEIRQALAAAGFLVEQVSREGEWRALLSRYRG